MRRISLKVPESRLRIMLFYTTAQGAASRQVGICLGYLEANAGKMAPEL
jgi:hypothetical protein